jgi:hypothetical protein
MIQENGGLFNYSVKFYLLKTGYSPFFKDFTRKGIGGQPDRLPLLFFATLFVALGGQR